MAIILHRPLGAYELKGVTNKKGETLIIPVSESLKGIQKEIQSIVRESGFDYFDGDVKQELTRILGENTFVNNRTPQKQGRNKGRKRVSKQTASIQTKWIISAINSALADAVCIGKRIAATDIAQYVGAYAYSRRRYNSWTGNLSNSYRISVVNNREVTVSRYFDSQIKNKSKIKNRIAKLADYKHKIYKASFRDGSFIRYAKGKGWIRKMSDTEKENGYRSTRGKNKQFSFAAIGKYQARSGIIVENTAPYADKVQNRGYTVLTNARAVKDYKTHATKLIAYAINSQLKSRGFKLTR